MIGEQKTHHEEKLGNPRLSKGNRRQSDKRSRRNCQLMALSKDDDSNDTRASVCVTAEHNMSSTTREDARRNRLWELSLMAQEIETE